MYRNHKYYVLTIEHKVNNNTWKKLVLIFNNEYNTYI